MNAETLVAAVVTAIAAATVVWMAARRQLRAVEVELQRQKEATRSAEEQLHRQQREAAAELNRLELEHQERSKAVRSSVFEEGRQLGLAEARREHVNELTAQQEAFARRLAAEREQVASDTREKTRAELELQAKLFDVSVRPYLKVDTVKGMFKDEEVIDAGYQYQLLVNGIPAFQPSIVIEESRRSSKVNEDNVNALLQVAERAAKAAAEFYLGTGAAAAKLGPAIIRRLKK